MKYILITFLVVGSLSCFPDVLFEEALPPGIEAIYQIPDLYHGQYLCEGDSSIMHIESDMAYVESYNQFITTIDKVQATENCSILAGGLYLPGRQSCIPIERINGDTIIGYFYSIDTLFSFQDDELLKNYKGRLYLNYLSSRSYWSTFVITPNSDGTLLWELIDVPDNDQKIEDITSDYKPIRDSKERTKYVMNPTLMEFEKILERDYMNRCDLLIPIEIVR